MISYLTYQFLNYDRAYTECATTGRPSENPIIEMTIPSVLDKTLAPEGSHTIGLFTQYSSITFDGKKWTDEQRENYTERLFSVIEDYAPGFKDSVLGVDVQN